MTPPLKTYRSKFSGFVVEERKSTSILEEHFDKQNIFFEDETKTPILPVT